MVNTKVTLCGIGLDNPVIPASGTFGYGAEFAALYRASATPRRASRSALTGCSIPSGFRIPASKR